MSCLAIDKSNTLSVVQIMSMSGRRWWCPITRWRRFQVASDVAYTFLEL